VVVPQDLFCFFNFDGDQVMDYYGNYSGINSGVVFSTNRALTVQEVQMLYNAKQ